MTRSLVLAALCAALAPFAFAQGTTTAPATGASPRKELAQKIVQMQQPAVENTARMLVEQPAGQLLQQASMALQQRVAADKREAVGQEIQNDARRYVEEALPPVRDRAIKIAPDVLGPLLESKLTEEELRQVIQVMQQIETPAYRKYLSLGQEMQRTLAEKLFSDVRASVEPKARALQDSIGKRLGMPPPAPASGAAPKKP